MLRLTVEDFSCIEEATLRLGRFTVLVGPQASGKSVLSKLNYFFINLLREQLNQQEDGKNINAFKVHVRDQFKEWFPPSAWGKKRFCIECEAGDFQVRLTRVGYKEKISENIRVFLSPQFEDIYQSALSAIEAVRQKQAKRENTYENYELFWRIHETTMKNWRKTLGHDYVDNQLFIPAGRSFFTSIGKAIVALEHGRLLDPLTSQFGRTLAAYRERELFMFYDGAVRKFFEGGMARQLFGGTLRFERDREVMETEDGRRIPFSSLSSGQQELLPLLLMLATFGMRYRRGRSERDLVYIEEPEAHLFPSAQGLLVEHLASLVRGPKSAIDMLVTTHSPYVLAKMNNLIKAGALAQKASDKVRNRVASIIPGRTWLEPGMVQAYAIKDRKVRAILDEEGLIDASYIDDVSNQIAREFAALLEIEVQQNDSASVSKENQRKEGEGRGIQEEGGVSE